MADTTVHSENRVEQWADDEFHEYVRMNPLSDLMGADEDSIIHVKEDLIKRAGDRLSFPFLTRLKGAGVTGDNTLEGNEEVQGNYAHQVTVDQLRHGVVLGNFEGIKTKIDLLGAARQMLRTWNNEQLRDLFIARFLSPVIGGLTTYASATEAEKDAWEVQNNPTSANQRIVFGGALANSTGDHSAGLATVDGTADDMHQDIVRLMKRRAQLADPHIKPVITQGNRAGKERFVHLMGSLAFRDLAGNFETVLQNADVRGEKNQIFSSGDIMVDNVVCREVPEFDRTVAAGGALISGVGAGGIDVSATFFCGAQALGLAWAQRLQVKTDRFDYSNRKGVAVGEIRGCEKLTYNSFMHGQATNYVSAVGD